MQIVNIRDILFVVTKVAFIYKIVNKTRLKNQLTLAI